MAVKTLDHLPRKPGEPLRLTDSLNQVLRQAKSRRGGKKKRPLTLGLIINVTAERAFGVLMAFLCLPFLTPIPVPFLGMPFGVALFLLGMQVSIQKTKPWLPAWLLKKKLPPRLTAGLFKFAARIFRPLEKIIHPRLLFMNGPAGKVAVGVALAVDGILLAMPWPPGVPCTNAIPSWMALIKILGLTERDGIALIVGSTITYAVVVGVVVGVAILSR